MSRDPHPAEAGGVPRPRRRARIAGPWYHSPKAALSGLAVLIAWGLLLPGATPVGGGMSTLGSLSLFGYALFSLVGGIVFLSNRNLGRVLSSCAAVGLLLLWGWLFVRYSGADWSRLAYVFFNFEILGESGMKALAGGFMTAIFLFDASHNVGPGFELNWMGVTAQLIAAFFGAAGFAMIFHLPRKYLAAASIGGILSWAIYLAVGCASNSVFFPALVASAFSALYSEALAQWRGIPSLLFVIPSVIPLIPGAPLYYTMSFAVAADWTQVAAYAMRTGQFALGIAVGMCVTWLFASLLKPRTR